MPVAEVVDRDHNPVPFAFGVLPQVSTRSWEIAEAEDALVAASGTVDDR
jgi:hypothetical protein